MAARIIKVAGLVVLAAALSAPFASAKPYVDAPRRVRRRRPWPVTSPYLDFPALTQAIKGTVAAPNDRAGTQGIGQTSTDTVGMGGQYGQNLIQQKAQDIQKAETFKLPAPPDERPGTSVGTPLVIPYLSHGIGVNAAQFSGSPVRPDDRAGARPSMPTNAPTSFAAPVSTTGDGFDWASAGFGAAGLAAIALAIGLLVVLGRRSRHEGVAVS